MEPGGNVLVLLLYRDTGELGWDQGVNILVSWGGTMGVYVLLRLIYRDAGELGWDQGIIC